MRKKRGATPFREEEVDFSLDPKKIWVRERWPGDLVKEEKEGGKKKCRPYHKGVPSVVCGGKRDRQVGRGGRAVSNRKGKEKKKGDEAVLSRGEKNACAPRREGREKALAGRKSSSSSSMRGKWEKQREIAR